MLPNERPPGGTCQADEGDAASLQVLLVPDASVGREQQLERFTDSPRLNPHAISNRLRTPFYGVGQLLRRPRRLLSYLAVRLNTSGREIGPCVQVPASSPPFSSPSNPPEIVERISFKRAFCCVIVEMGISALF
jgi:hypothetical protein